MGGMNGEGERDGRLRVPCGYHKPNGTKES